MNLPKRFRVARERAGLSKPEVARRLTCGVTDTMIRDWEKGDAEPNLSQLAVVAKMYRRSISWFFEEGEPGPDAKVLWCGKEAGA